MLALLLFASPTSALRPNTITLYPCIGHEVTAQQFRSFSAEVWALDRWERARPAPATIAAQRRALQCATGPGHRKAMKATWKRDQTRFHDHRRYKLRWGECSDAGPVRDCIHGAALTYGADESWMLRVSYCESRWDRFARNGSSGSSGLFQFIPSTWATTPYASKSIWSARWQSLAAAWMASQGRQSEWVCR